MMGKRNPKSIDEVRTAMLALLPTELTLFVDMHWCDNRARGHWHQTQRCDAAVWCGQRELFRVTAPTPPDLYRNFSFALAEARKPRRIAEERAPAPPARARVSRDGVARLAGRESSDEHDGVAATRTIRHVEARRICGPS